MAASVSTPVNTVSRDNLSVLIRNNVLNNSFEFSPDPNSMEMDSPVRKCTSLQPITKKLFHSPISEVSPKGATHRRGVEITRRARKRRQNLLPDSSEKIKKAYVQECDRDSSTPDSHGGM